jgi:glycosyltransferase involved in cell wall biosynthesis
VIGSSVPVGETTTGPGLILTETLRAFESQLGITPRVIVFRAEKAFRDGAADEWVEAPPLRAKIMLRASLGLPLDDVEREFLSRAAQATADAQVFIWLGSAYDPVTAYLPRTVGVPAIFHPSDSVTLFQQRALSWSARKLKVHVARRAERRSLRAGYARSIYVAHDDFESARALSSGDPRVLLLPLGVDTDEFTPRVNARRRGPIRLLFSGVMFYRPNVEAALFLLREVMPLVRSQVELRIAGREPVEAIREAAKGDPRIVVTGTVPDMAAEYRDADLFVAPMISASGMKIKILQAFASGLPVVTSRLGVESFGQEVPGVVLAESAAEMAAAIDRLVADSSYGEALGAAARTFIMNGWSWSARTRRLLTIIQEIMAASPISPREHGVMAR